MGVLGDVVVGGNLVEDGIENDEDDKRRVGEGEELRVGNDVAILVKMEK